MTFSTRPAVLPHRSGLAARVAAIAIAAVVAVVLAPGAALAQTQYTIQSGDTLAGIAAAHDSSVQAIADANGIADVNLIIAGATLTIPGGSAPVAEEAPASAPEPAPAPAPEPAPAAASGGVWDRLAQCESGGNWSINTGNGYYGGLQFSESSWHAVGGTGLPHEHSRETQIAMAERLLAAQGWGAWPACSAKLGLR